jgi:hypothetical protein
MSGQFDGAAVQATKTQIQMLADEIAALRAIPADDPRRVTADRVVAVKVDTIRTLRSLLPGIATGAAEVGRRPEWIGARRVTVAGW